MAHASTGNEYGHGAVLGLLRVLSGCQFQCFSANSVNVKRIKRAPTTTRNSIVYFQMLTRP